MIRAAGRVARFEYMRHVRSKQFLGTTFGMPLFMLLVGGFAAWSGSTAQDATTHPWGYVGAGLPPAAAEALSATDLRPFADVETAAAALAAGAVGGYAAYDGALGYRVTAWEPLPDGVSESLSEAIRAEALSAAPPELRAAFDEPATIVYALAAAPDHVRSSGTLWATLAVAFAVPLALTLAVLFSTTLLVTAVAEEKANRLIECLATSVAPLALVGGKVVGLGLLALTQLGIWAAGAAAAAVIGLRLGVPGATVAAMPWPTVALAGIWLVGGYLVQAALVVGLGIAIGEPREAQQVAGFASLGLVLPFSLAGLLVFRPASPAAVWLSILPLTSPVAMPIRLLLSAVPLGQAVASAALLALTAVLALWAAGAVFRWAMLRPPIRWRRRAKAAQP